MARISWTLWNVIVLQLLVGKAASIGSGKNSLRGRRDLLEEPSLDQTQNFPFIASLMDYSYNHVCGGTFIAIDMLLTAASCENEAPLKYVHVHDGATNEDVTLEIAATFPNPDYNALTGERNTMVVKLTNRVGQSLSSSKEPSDMIVQVMLNDANAGRPSSWPVSILKEGQGLTGFNYQHDKNDGFQDEWRDWKMPYIGRDTCTSEVEESGVFQNFTTPEDSFCLSRPNVQFMESSPSPVTCHNGEVGGPILWKSDTTGAQLLLGVNTWGVGCRSLVLPDLGSLAFASGNFIRETVCSESLSPPNYMGCPREKIKQENSAVILSSEYGAFFASKPSTTVSGRSGGFVGGLIQERSDPVTVYMLLLFDATTSKHVLWTIREAFTRKVVKSVSKGTYDSHADFTELVQLVPGKTYELLIDDNSIASSRERFRGKFMEFALVLAEPPQEIKSGVIESGKTESFLFRIPKVTQQLDSPEEVVGDSLSVNVTEAPVVTAMTPPPSLEPSPIPTSASPSSSSPSELPVDFPSFAPSEIPVTNSTLPTMAPTLSKTPSSRPIESTPGPSSSPQTCAAKGETCVSSSDCCDGRCSPAKVCFANNESGRQRAAPGQHGGAAGNLSRRKRIQVPSPSF